VVGETKMQQVEIRVRGQIDRDWSGYFGSLIVNHNSQGETVLSGSFRDQAELRGMLSRLADLGLELISVTTKPEGAHDFQEEEVIVIRKEDKTNFIQKKKAK
jgi:hypothetical protein